MSALACESFDEFEEGGSGGGVELVAAVLDHGGDDG
jgi:hypothetical protein